jgi:hypothetical protein
MEEKTLRDEFAMAALSGALANPNLKAHKLDTDPHTFARDMYKLADAMVKARANRP